MTDAEISRKLALAIGYKRKHMMKNLEGGISVCRRGSPQGFPLPGWYRFDYRDPAVIWPIAERYNRWPRKEGDVWTCDPSFTASITANTAAKAAALAVIKLHEGSKT